MWYLLIVIGFALIAIDIILHGGHAGFFLIFPFFYGRGGILSIIGIILIFIGFFLAPFWFMRKAMREYGYSREESFATRYGPLEKVEVERPQEESYWREIPEDLSEGGMEEREKRRSSFGGVIFIGPFPIVFGGGENREEVIKWAVIGAIVIGILMAVLVTLYAVLRRTRFSVQGIPEGLLRKAEGLYRI